jgi:hypothetical protein
MRGSLAVSDLAGFAKPSVWWYRSWWLHAVADDAADKPFTTGEDHVVRIVESWERPSTRPLSNGTTLVPCSDTLPGQHLSFSGSIAATGTSPTGTISTTDGLCIDGSCANLTTSKCSILRFVPCDATKPSLQWSFDAETKRFTNEDNGGCLETGNGYPFYSSDIRDDERSQEVGIAVCSGAAGQTWEATAHGFKNLGVYEAAPSSAVWCLTNGRGDDSGAVFQALHVYSDLPTVELYLNGKRKRFLVDSFLSYSHGLV